MKKMIWKRVFAVLLAVCMAAVLLPNTLPAARAEGHVHEEAPGAEWIPLSLEKNSEGGKDMLKAGDTPVPDNHCPAGNYYLAEDMVLSSTTTVGSYGLYFADESVLCLNGHTLTCQVYAEAGCDLTISDCGEGGSITRASGPAVYIKSGGTVRLVSGTLNSTGGSNNEYNVYVSVGGTFVMLGGTVTAPKQRGVYISGTAVISGGTISSGADAIWLSKGPLTLSGSPILSSGDEKDDADISMGKGALITLEDFTGAPDGPYTVRTSATDFCQFAEGAVSGDVSSFTAKNPGYMVEYRDGQLWFGAHEHQWDEGWTTRNSIGTPVWARGPATRKSTRRPITPPETRG